MTGAGEVEAFLEDAEHRRAAIVDILAVDAEQETWTFDDIAADSGTFGELVSRGIVVQDGRAYRLADRTAVEAALNGDDPTSGDGSTIPRSLSFSRVSDIDKRAALALCSALVFVVAFRTTGIGKVYRGSDIVLSGNDPYYYRYWVERVASETGGLLDFRALAVLSDTVVTGEPLYVATTWWTSSLLGGGTAIIGHVLAWYPVVGAVLSGIMLYQLALVVTDDRRVALAAVLFLGIIPGHAIRTSLGYADHHAFDYLWLSLTSLSLVVLVVRSRERTGWKQTGIPILGLAVGIAGQTLSWEAGPLLVLPVGLVAATAVLTDLHADRPVVSSTLPMFAGTALGAAFVWSVHAVAGFQSPLVASTPAALALGVGVVMLLAGVVERLTGEWTHLAVVQLVGGLTTILVLQGLAPREWQSFLERAGSLFRSDAIAETSGLFDPGSLGFVLLLGFALIVGFPAILIGTKRATSAPDWLVVSVYGWYFLALATLQVRFVGELATFIALFAGYGFVALAHRLEIVRPLGADRGSLSVPERRTITALCLLFLLVGSLGLVQTPLKTNQVIIGDDAYETASTLATAQHQSVAAGQERYVFSEWGRNRMYNYFANGDSRSYRYAKQYYRTYLASTDETSWFHRLNGRVGHIVVDTAVTGQSAAQLATRLSGQVTAGETVEGLSHHRAVYVSDDETYAAYRLVPGAYLAGQGDPNSTVEVETKISVPGSDFTYERTARTTAAGNYILRVPYAATYPDAGVSVSEAAVESGRFGGQRRPQAHWAFDDASGDVVFDSRGGNHGWLYGGRWGSGIDGAGIEFDGDGYAEIEQTSALAATDQFSVSLWFRTAGSADGYTPLLTKMNGSARKHDGGYQLSLSDGAVTGAVGDGTNYERIVGPAVADGDWHQVVLSKNETTISVAVDGRVVGTRPFAGTVETDYPLRIGAGSGSQFRFDGQIDEVRFTNTPLTRTQIANRYRATVGGN